MKPTPLVWCAAVLQVLEKKYALSQAKFKVAGETKTVAQILDEADAEIAQQKTEEVTP